MTARADRTLALVAGGVLALVFTIMSAVGWAGHSVGTVEHTSHRVVPGPVRELRIDAESGDITILPASGDDVTIDSRAKGSLGAPRLRTDVVGSDVHVNGGCPEISFGHCSATLVVHAPRGTNVYVESGSGDVRVEGLTDDATLHTASGDIIASELAGPVELETGSGDIIASGLRSADATAKTGSGDVRLGFDAAPDSASAETGSGDIQITVPRGSGAYSVDYETGSGDERIGVDRSTSATHELHAKTGSGDVEIRYAG